MNVSEFEVEELVRGIGNLGDGDDEAFDYIREEFDMDWDSFVKLINVLLPLIVVAKSPLTGNTYKGFGNDGIFFIKQAIS